MSKIRTLDRAESEKYLTVDEASELLDVKPNVLRNYLSQDKLTTYKFKTLTLLSKSEIERWKSGE